MKRFLLLPVVLLTLALAGCAAFHSGVRSVNQAVANVSAELAKACDEAEAIGKQLAVESYLAKGGKAQAALYSVNAGIDEYCQHPPRDTWTAILAVSAVVKTARAAYRKARAS